MRLTARSRYAELTRMCDGYPKLRWALRRTDTVGVISVSASHNDSGCELDQVFQINVVGRERCRMTETYLVPARQ